VSVKSLAAMPVVPLAVAFAVGIVISPRAPASASWVIGSSAIALSVGFLLARREHLASVTMLISVAAVATVRSAVPALPPHHLATVSLPSTVRLEGRLAAEPRARGPDFTQIVLEADAVITDDTRRIVTGRIQIALNGPLPPLAEGQRIAGEFRLHQPRSFRNPGAFDYSAYLARHDIYLLGSGHAERVRVLEPYSPSWRVTAKRWAVDTIRAALPPVSAALLAGILLGERDELPPEIQDTFRRAGVYHVLAVSGFNVALLAAAVFAALALFRVPLAAAAVVAIVVVVGFAAVVGKEPSVLRAVVMAVLTLVALVLSRHSSLLNSLALAALLILALRPGELLEPGFQLSFGATLGIVLFVEPVRGALTARGCPRWLAEVIGVSASAQAAVAPIMLTHFNQVSTIGVLSNLAVVPLAAIATLAGLLALLAAAVHGALGQPLFDGVWVTLLALRACAHGAARVPGAMLHLSSPPLTASLAFYAGLGLLLWMAGRRQERFRILPPPGSEPVSEPARGGVGGTIIPVGALAIALFTTAAAIVLWPLLRPADGRLRLSVLDVGQGDAIVIELPDGRVVLVDTGPGGARRLDTGERIVAPFLWNRGVRRLAAVIVTHDDADHAGGLPSILRLFRVDELWTSAEVLPGRRWFGNVPVTVLAPVRPVAGPGGSQPAARAALPGQSKASQPPGQARPDPHRAQNSERTRSASGRGLTPEKARTDRTRAADRNNRSIVIRIDHGLLSFLLAADIETEAESFLRAAQAPLRTTVLKVAHHGGRRSTGAAFLAESRPTFAVISVGSRNRFGHPAPETLARLREVGARIYRTDEHGAVMLESDGQDLVVSTGADGRRQRFSLYPSNERSI
jgi:competence protein ComEC